MNEAEEKNPVPEQKPPARLRPNGKQRRLLALVFKEGLSFEDAACQLHLRPQTVVDWLKQPLFIQYMFHHMTRFYVTAQIDRLRGAAKAVSSLSSADLSDARRKAYVDLLRLHKVFSLDPAEVFGSLSESDGPRLGHVGPQSDPLGPRLGLFGPRCDPLGPRSDSLGPRKNTLKSRFQPQNPHSAPSSTENQPKSGPSESGPNYKSSLMKYLSPYSHYYPFDPDLSNLDWFQKMFEDWDTKHPDDPDVLLFRKFREERRAKQQNSAPVSLPHSNGSAAIPGQKVTDRQAREMLAAWLPKKQNKVAMEKPRQSHY